MQRVNRWTKTSTSSFLGICFLVCSRFRIIMKTVNVTDSRQGLLGGESARREVGPGYKITKTKEMHWHILVSSWIRTRIPVFMEAKIFPSLAQPPWSAAKLNVPVNLTLQAALHHFALLSLLGLQIAYGGVTGASRRLFTCLVWNQQFVTLNEPLSSTC
jgi:hypothetical protein